MKLTKAKLRALIYEEIDNVLENDNIAEDNNMQQEGLLDMLRKEKQPEFKPSRGDLSSADWEAHKDKGELKSPKDAAALKNSYAHIHTFLEDEKQLDNVERFHAMRKLIRKLSDEMIWNK